MLFAVIFEDYADKLEVRRALLPGHISWLDQHRAQVLVGGSLREAVDANPVGGLWIVEAADRAEIEELLQTDPFHIGGLRKSWAIRHWTKAFPDQKVPV